MQLFWHRRDPRTRDNAGLAAAARAGTVLPAFVYDADLFETMGARQRAFLLGHVKRLERRYRDLGSDLVVRAGDPENALVDIAEEYDVETAFYNEYDRPARRNRQRAVEDAMAAVGVETNSYTDAVLVAPGRLDERYANHSRFHDDWEAAPKRGPYGEPDAESLAAVRDGKTVPEPDADIDLPAAGYEGARERFDESAGERQAAAIDRLGTDSAENAPDDESRSADGADTDDVGGSP